MQNLINSSKQRLFPGNALPRERGLFRSARTAVLRSNSRFSFIALSRRKESRSEGMNLFNINGLCRRARCANRIAMGVRANLCRYSYAGQGITHHPPWAALIHDC